MTIQIHRQLMREMRRQQVLKHWLQQRAAPPPAPTYVVVSQEQLEALQHGRPEGSMAAH